LTSAPQILSNCPRLDADCIHDQRTIRIHRNGIGPEWICRFPAFGKRHHLPFGGAQRIDGDQRLASTQSIAGTQVLHRNRLQNHKRPGSKRFHRQVQSHMPAHNAQSHAFPCLALPCPCARSTIPTTTMRAGVLLPSFARAISPSVETITIDPFPAPSQSTTTIGSAPALPSASSRCASRNRQPSSVGCFTAETTVPSIRARNMVI